MQPSIASSVQAAALPGSQMELAGANMWQGDEAGSRPGAGTGEAAAPSQADGQQHQPSGSAVPSLLPNTTAAAAAASEITASSSNPSGDTAGRQSAGNPPEPSAAAGGAAVAAADPQGIPVLPDIVRQKEAKRDLPLICHIEGCGLDLQGQAEYYQRYRICKAHLKSSALLVDGVPQRFCQQCGRFHELADFDGDKRNCRARLEQHNSRRRKVVAASQTTRRSRSQKEQRPRGGVGTGEEEGELEGMAGVEDAALLAQYSSRGGAGSRSKQLSGWRRSRGVMEGDEPLTLTPQEKEAILLLRQTERPGGGQAMPRFRSEPVRGVGGRWPASGGAADVPGGPLSNEELLNPKLQDLMGQEAFAGLAPGGGSSRLGAGGAGASAFHTVPAQPPQQQPALRPPLPMTLQSFASTGNAREEPRLADFLGASAAQPAGGLAGSNPFASGANAAAAGGLLEKTAGGLYRNFTEPVGMRGQGREAASAMPQAPATSQLLAPTIPRTGLSGRAPRDAADLLRSLTNASAPTPPPQPVPQPVANPFMQRAAAPAPVANSIAGLGEMAALLSGTVLGGTGLKASTLLRQMADLAATAEMTMEQAAMQQAAAGAGAQPLSSVDAFRAPLQYMAEDLMRRLAGGAAAAGRGSAAAPAPTEPAATFGGSGGGGSGGAADAAAELLAALAGAPLAQPQAQQVQQAQQLEQQPSREKAAGSSEAGAEGGAKDPMSEALLAALLSENNSSQRQTGSSALVQDLLHLLQGSNTQGQQRPQQQQQQSEPEAHAQ